jgi:adenylate kinase
VIFVFIGMPGSGKGTQAEKLVKEFGFRHIALGDILRSYTEKNNEISREIKDLIDKGKLISDDIANKIIADEIRSSQENNIILDGYPRKVSQLRFLENNFLDKDIFVVYFKVRKESLVKRLLDRVVCKDCKSTFSDHNFPSQDSECDKCKSKNLMKRNDDDEQTIMKRMDVFDQETYPIIEDIKAQESTPMFYLEVDGSDSIENINKILCNIVKRH